MAQSRFITQQFSAEEFVESCGAILFDLSNPNTEKVCLVNLVKHDEWLLAKGRRNIGESRKDTAIREVTEETGYQCHLLPVRMSTRACHPEDPANAPDEPQTHENVTEPFMCTVRELPHGKGVKVIWWFIAVLDENALEQKGRGEDELNPLIFSLSEALDKLYFESDREVLRKAIQILKDTTLHERC